MYLILVQTSFLHLVETLATFIASVHSWSFSPSIATLMGGLPAPLGYFAGPATVWFLPDYSTFHWSCVTRVGGGQLPEGDGAERSIDWPCDLSNRRTIVILTLLSSLFSCSSRLRFIWLSWSHIPSCSYFVLSHFGLKNRFYFSSSGHRYPQGPEKSVKDWTTGSQRSSTRDWKATTLLSPQQSQKCRSRAWNVCYPRVWNIVLLC